MRHPIAGLASVVFLAVASVASAQPEMEQAVDSIAPEGAELSPRLRFEHISTDDGLPQSHITAILQDAVGFMWFGTQEGLVRFDGYRTVVYLHVTDGPSAQLPSSYITSLALDSRGNVWVGTESGLAIRLRDHDRFVVPEVPEEIADQAVTALQASDESVWIGYGATLARAGVEDHAVSIIEGGPSIGTSIEALAVDSAKNLWIGTLGDGLFRRSPKGEVKAYRQSSDGGLRGNTINDIHIGTDGELWLATKEAGVAHFDGSRFEHITAGPSGLTDSRATFISDDGRGQLWMGTEDGLNILDLESRAVQQIPADLRDDTSLSYQWLTAGYTDAGGVTWIGTMAGGISKVNAIQMHFRNIKTAGTGAAFAEGDGGVLWIGTYPGSLIRYQTERQVGQVRKLLPTADGDFIDLAPYWVAHIQIDDGGVLWMAVYGLGLVSYDPKREIAELYGSKVIGTESLWRFAWVGDALWLATWGNSLVRFDPETKRAETFADEQNGLPPYLYSVATDRSNPQRLWLGSAKGGLVRFDITSRAAKAYVNVAENPSSLSNDDVTSIYQDDEGILWVGTYGGGLNRFDPSSEKFQRFDREIDLPNSTIYGILGDEAGNLWMSTNGGGLVRFEPKSKELVAFGVSDGAVNEHAQNAYYADSSGRFYFGAPIGFYSFSPDTLEPDSYVPPVVVTGLRIFNERPDLERAAWDVSLIDLGFRETTLTIEFAALAFANPSKLRYQYKIEGIHKDFIDVEVPIVPITGIDDGEYTVRVRAANRHGVWNEKGAVIRLHVAPPPWRTWWAYTVYGLLFLAVIAAYVRYQNRRVERVRQENRLAEIERDLELTSAVQTGCLPQEEMISTPGCNVLGFYRPADKCSGDWWWYDRTVDNKQLILIGDVTGHGTAPAMVTAATAAAWRVGSSTTTTNNIPERLAAMSQEVQRVGRGRYLMAFSALLIDLERSELHLFGAGGLPIVLLRTDGKVEQVVARGTPMGSDDFQLGTATRTLGPGDRVFACTDGIPEIVMTNGRQMGLRRLAQHVGRTQGMPLAIVRDSLLQEAEAVLTAGPEKVQRDDWTFILIDVGT
jgi:ligand-binding sensor domain-containing protein/serine phosphatase RsbU (regulator of sigma subunit)